VCHHGIETDPPVSIFQVTQNIFTQTKLKCQCCNGGLKFVLLEHIHNTQLHECQSNNEHVCHFSTDVTQLLNLENASKTCVLPTACPPKATSNMLKNFPQFNTKFDTSFSGNTKITCRHTLVCNKPLLCKHTRYSLIPCRK